MSSDKPKDLTMHVPASEIIGKDEMINIVEKTLAEMPKMPEIDLDNFDYDDAVQKLKEFEKHMAEYSIKERIAIASQMRETSPEELKIQLDNIFKMIAVLEGVFEATPENELSEIMYGALTQLFDATTGHKKSLMMNEEVQWLNHYNRNR